MKIAKVLTGKTALVVVTVIAVVCTVLNFISSAKNGTSISIPWICAVASAISAWSYVISKDCKKEKEKENS